jgi:hypothetical protein
MSDDERDTVHDCEDCGHAYSSNYGRWVEVAGGQRWLCHPCVDRRAGREPAGLPRRGKKGERR